MRSINLANLCMEEDDYTMKKNCYCNHGLVVRLKTSWTSNNPRRRYWSCPYYGGPRSCHFWCWKDKENIDPRSKFVILKLQKLGKLENIVESSQTSATAFELVEVTEEVDKPEDFKQDDDCLGMKLKMLQEEVEKMKGMQNNWRRT
ncbi:hypothetical protein H5410_045888 [Solanum commersonii]|uniref:Zinc finger GRF-type domain-containing protein n=1 Tax=Solanum commersonii TaxID=4109 RepID=A0A9J5XE24_SOLCO|nr:hypothetical protein H5410_045888 [Solanum commersonii]